MSKGDCLLCFALNSKLFNTNDTQSMYEEISDLKAQNESELLCFICHARLQQSYLLLEQALQVQLTRDYNEIIKVKDESVVQLSKINDLEASIPYSETIKQDHEDKKLECLNDSEKQVNCDTQAGESLQSTKTNHKTIKPYSCEFCHRRFSSPQLLIKHKLIHNGDKPYTCEVCKKKYYKKNDLNRHKITHSGDKPFGCDICNKKFYQSSHLKVHKQTHTGDKPYSCDICMKKFYHSGHLKDHKRTHTGEKPYACDICSKRFGSKGNLKEHKVTHSSDKPFSCDICNSKFSHKRALRRHKIAHEGTGFAT